MLTKRTVTRIKHLPNTLKIPKTLYDSELSTVQFGSKCLPCHIIPSENEECHINTDLSASLHLPPQPKFRIIIRNDTVHFLPLIGCYTTHINWGTQEPLGEESTFQEKWLQLTQQNGGTAFFFTDKQIHWDEGTILGLIYTNNKWEEHLFPFPDVIYDRIANRKAERLSPMQKLKTIFNKDYKIPWFNPGFFDKWEVHSLLYKEPGLSTFLPETQPYSRENLVALLKKHQTLLLKPRHKSRGSGIIQVDASNNEGFWLKRSGMESGEKFFCSNIKKLLHDLNTTDLSEETYIIQQGINLYRHHEHPVDFRIHSNKNKKGKWKISAVAAKCAAEGQITTHLAYGGHVKSLRCLFGPTEGKNVLNRLSNVVLNMSKALDEQLEETIGELGFDMALDQGGQIWLFEINSKPRHHIFLSPSIRQQLKLVHHHWLDYCSYLSILSNREPTT